MRSSTAPFAFILVIFFVLPACGAEEGAADASGGEASTADASVRDATTDGRDDGPLSDLTFGRWNKVEIPGTVCGNGSQYKFFVNPTHFSDNLLVYFEPGGACWDFDSCSHRGGVMGAANPEGIPDNHMNLWRVAAPIIVRSNSNPLKGWNYVFVPYCTGDIHSGRGVKTYVDPLGEEPDLKWHHAGHADTQAVIGWMREHFTRPVPKMLLTGCSAGGTGSLANYYFFRKGLPNVEHGYLLSDSGPIFPDSGNSKPMHDTIRAAWDLDGMVHDEIPAFESDLSDLGALNDLLANEFPNDRLATTYFRLDYNYSLYSYRRFYSDPSRSEVYRLWWEDTQLMMAQYDAHANLSYYLPFWREDNSSHCLTIIRWEGTEIEEEGIDLRGYVEHLLDDSTPLRSYLETAREGPYADMAP